MRQDGYISNNLGDGVNAPQEKATGFGSDKRTAATYPLADHDSGYGVIEDHYGGKKLGMTRVRISKLRDGHVNAWSDEQSRLPSSSSPIKSVSEFSVFPE